MQKDLLGCVILVSCLQNHPSNSHHISHNSSKYRHEKTANSIFGRTLPQLSKTFLKILTFWKLSHRCSCRKEPTVTWYFFASVLRTFAVVCYELRCEACDGVVRCAQNFGQKVSVEKTLGVAASKIFCSKQFQDVTSIDFQMASGKKQDIYSREKTT